MKIWIDTNILIDVLKRRTPFDIPALQILELCETNQIDGYISALTVVNLAYILRKDYTPGQIKQIAKVFHKILYIVDVTKEDIVNAANDTVHTDFEDAVQISGAIRCDIAYFITRNQKDFQNCPFMVCDATEFLQKS